MVLWTHQPRRAMFLGLFSTISTPTPSPRGILFRHFFLISLLPHDILIPQIYFMLVYVLYVSVLHIKSVRFFSFSRNQFSPPWRQYDSHWECLIQKGWGAAKRKTSYVPETWPQIALSILKMTCEVGLVNFFILQMIKQRRSHGLACLRP